MAPPRRLASTGSRLLALLVVVIGVGVVALAAIVGVAVVGQWNSPYTPSGTFLTFALGLAGSALVTVGVCNDGPLLPGRNCAARGFDIVPATPDSAIDDE